MAVKVICTKGYAALGMEAISPIFKLAAAVLLLNIDEHPNVSNLASVAFKESATMYDDLSMSTRSGGKQKIFTVVADSLEVLAATFQSPMSRNVSDLETGLDNLYKSIKNERPAMARTAVSEAISAIEKRNTQNRSQYAYDLSSISNIAKKALDEAAKKATKGAGHDEGFTSNGTIASDENHYSVELDQSANDTFWGLSDLINALDAIANQNG